MFIKSDFIITYRKGIQVKHYKKVCDNCETEIGYAYLKNKVTLCKRCQYEKLSKMFSQPKIEVLCASCGKPLFYTKSQFEHGKIHTCSKECLGKIRRKDITDVKRHQLKSKMLQAGVVPICITCGHNHLWNLQAHHKVFVSNGGANSLDNLEFQCRNCHADIHHENEDKLE